MRKLLTLALLIPLWAGATDTRGVSLYDLPEKLVNQESKPVGLDVHRGNKVLVTMFYGGCQATCPLIIETLRSVERKLDAAQRADLRVLLISFDPEHDTPAALRELAVSRRIDTQRWTLTQAEPAAVRRIAAALDIQYRRLPEGQFNHANVIAVLGENGEILARSIELGHADESLVKALTAK